MRWRARSLFSIPPSWFEGQGFSALLTDLDNTLASAYDKLPSQRAIDSVANLKKRGIKVYLVSNNTGRRCARFARALGADGYLAEAKKPKSHRIEDFLKERGIPKGKAVMVGDQIFTDAEAAKGAGLSFVLTEKLTWKELPWTYFNRIGEIIFRRRWIRQGRYGEEISGGKEL